MICLSHWSQKKAAQGGFFIHQINSSNQFVKSICRIGYHDLVQYMDHPIVGLNIHGDYSNA